MRILTEQEMEEFHRHLVKIMIESLSSLSENALIDLSHRIDGELQRREESDE